jgi:recombination protein RecT
MTQEIIKNNPVQIIDEQKQTKLSPIMDILVSRRKQIYSLVPDKKMVDRMLRVIAMEIKKNPNLMNCKPESVWGSVLNDAQLGLEVGGTRGLCYLIPYKDQCQFILGYRGMLDLIGRANILSNIPIPRIVYKNDIFKLQYGDSPRLTHLPADDDRGEIKGAYVVFELKTGGKAFDYMSIEEIYQIRDKSPGYASSKSAWHTDPTAMILKCPIRRIFKYIPTNPMLQHAIGLDEAADYGGQNNADVLEDLGGIESVDQKNKSSKLSEELVI